MNKQNQFLRIYLFKNFQGKFLKNKAKRKGTVYASKQALKSKMKIFS